MTALTEPKCRARKAQWDALCGTEDVRMAFVPQSTGQEAAPDADLESMLPLAAGDGVERTAKAQVTYGEAFPWVNQDGLKVDATEEAEVEERERDTSQEDLANPAEPSAEEPVVPSQARAEAKEEDCHDAREGEWCFRAVKWAMTRGIVKNPKVYRNLTAVSSFAEFQNNLYHRSRGSCKKPCATAAPAARAAAPAAQETEDDEAYPSDPGCYMRAPSGCPNRPNHLTKTWRHDVVAEGRADLDDAGCQERKERWDEDCGTADVKMAYIPSIALMVDGTRA
jgi:hypothetical protein